MADADQVPGDLLAEKEKNTKDEGMREVKILMLHGYTQSGPLFRAKTRALEKQLAKGLAPQRLKPVLLYPTAPTPLSARDIPGYQPAPGDDDDGAPPAANAWAWLRHDRATGAYRHLAAGLARIAACVRRSGGGVDGVLGFSQGGFMAAAVAAALETPPRRAPPRRADADANADADDTAAAVAALRAANGGRALRFAVVYSGFAAPPAAGLAWLLGGGARLRTPTLHFIGSLDTVVEEGRSRALVAQCGGAAAAAAAAAVVVHPGGHHVPVAREWVAPLVGFVRRYAGEEGAGAGEGGG